VREVSHTTVVSLRSLEDGDYLCHDVTKEQVRVGAVGECRLRFSGGFAWISSKGSGARWANAIFRRSLWTDAETGEQLIYFKHIDGEEILWLTELQVRYDVCDIATTLSKDGLEVRFGFIVYRFPFGRPDSKLMVFWDMPTVQRLLGLRNMSGGFAARWLRHGFCGAWKRMFELRSIGDEHRLGATRAQQSDAAVALMALSTQALLCWLAHLAGAMADQENRASATHMLQSLVATSSPGTCWLSGSFKDAAGRSCTASLQLVQGRLSVAALKASSLWTAISSSARYSLGLKDVEHIDVCDLLLKLHRRPSSSGVAYSAVLAWLAARVEQLQASPVQCSRNVEVLKWHRMSSAALRQVVVSHNLEVARARAKARAQRTVSQGRFCGMVKQKIQQTSREQGILMKRYWLATRRSLAGTTDVALACDASRFGGREQMTSIIMSLDSGICAWAPPQASFSEVGWGKTQKFF
jgi:hypothetical protein